MPHKNKTESSSNTFSFFQVSERHLSSTSNHLIGGFYLVPTGWFAAYSWIQKIGQANAVRRWREDDDVLHEFSESLVLLPV